MAIRFKCPHCKKPLAVKDDLAGKRAVCPACKKPIVIPAPIAPPADVEAMAAAALSEQSAEPAKDDAAKQIEFVCSFCDEPVTAPADMAGKRMPCPSCRQILKVPQPKVDKPKDWREVTKHGPTAAIVNLPEQLEGAWGTELKGRVGRESLEDAGAIEIEVEPIGIGGWIKRVSWTAAAISLITLIVVGVNRKKTQTTKTTTFASVRAYLKSLEDDVKKKPHPALLGEIERLEGEMALRDGKRDEALKKFKSAWAVATSGAKDTDIERDFFLFDLARSQVEMGKDNEGQFRDGIRFDWDIVVKEVKRSLDKIKNNEAKVIAIRELSSDLVARHLTLIAIGLAAGQFNPAAADKGQASPMLPQLTALVFAYGKESTKLELKPPDFAKPNPSEIAARLAYAEGHARKGNMDEVHKLVFDYKGLAHQNLETATSVAAVLLSDKSDKSGASKAAPYVAKAMEIHKGQKYPAWHTLQLCRAAFRVPDQAAAAKAFGLKLPGNFKRRAQLEWVYAQLERDDGKVTMELVKEFPDPGGAARTLAWIALARHLGSDCELPSEDGEDAAHREFVKIGQLVRKPQRQK